MRKHNWHPKLVERYLVRYYKNIRSRDSVRVYLKLFFTTMNKEPGMWLKQSKKAMKDDIWKFAEIIENKPSKTQSTALNMLKKFIERHDIEFKSREWEEVRQRNNLIRAVRPTVKKATPTQHDLKKILSHTTGIKSKAFFVLLASTGLRRNEALNLAWDDIDMDNRMILLDEDTAKGGIPRFTFFTEEAKELLELWKPERDKELEKLYRKSTALRKSLEERGYEIKKEVRNSTYTIRGKEYHLAYWKIYKDGREIPKEELIKLDNRVFPYESENFEKMWYRLLEKAGEPYDKKDMNPKLQQPRHYYNIHSLRRFWFTQLRADRMNDEFYNYIGGHTSLLDRTYGDWLHDTIMQQNIKEEYDRHMSALSIYEVQPDLTGIQEQLKEKDKQISNLEQRIKNMESRRSDEVAKYLLNSPEGIEKLRNIMHDVLERERNKKA